MDVNVLISWNSTVDTLSARYIWNCLIPLISDTPCRDTAISPRSGIISFSDPCVCRIELSNPSYLTVVCKWGSVFRGAWHSATLFTSIGFCYVRFLVTVFTSSPPSPHPPARHCGHCNSIYKCNYTAIHQRSKSWSVYISYIDSDLLFWFGIIHLACIDL